MTYEWNINETDGFVAVCFGPWTVVRVSYNSKNVNSPIKTKEDANELAETIKCIVEPKFEVSEEDEKNWKEDEERMGLQLDFLKFLME